MRSTGLELPRDQWQRFKQADLSKLASGSTRLVCSMPCWGLIIHTVNRTAQCVQISTTEYEHMQTYEDSSGNNYLYTKKLLDAVCSQSA